MSNFPTDYDDDTTLPVVNDNITEIGGDAINALREAVFNIEQDIGLGAAGSAGTIADRLGVALLPDGSLKPSVITNLGFITYGGGGITNAEVNVNAEIDESKLKLDYRTQDLFNYTRDLAGDINVGIGWISTIGIKLEPHLLGAIYRHTLDQIDVIANPDLYLENKFRTLRDNSDSFKLVNDINNEFLAHQWADSSVVGTVADVVTNNGSTYPSNYAHTASGLFLDTSRFSTIPQTAEDLQSFAQFIDSASIFLYGTRIQNLYSNGISKVSRSSNLAADGYGPALVPPTQVTAYLQNTGMSSSPLDDIDIGDDIIEFKPTSSERTSFSFDEKFALVKAGDVVRINYGTIEVSFIVKEKKYISNIDPLDNKYLIRIAGKNLFATSTGSARIDKSLVNSNKFGVLAIASAQIVSGDNNALSSPAVPSLIVGSPRGAMALGVGFNPVQFNSTHYNLYLALFTTGFPSDGYTILPAIDVTGNAGATPGKYTLESIVEATNRAFRRPGYNYRFSAFSYKGEFGIMLDDSYDNAAFSIISAAVDSTGSYDQTATDVNLPNNVVGIFATDPATAPDPLGFGPGGSGVASPPYMTSYGSSAAALLPTKLFTALKRNNYYVDGTERDKLNLELGQTLDNYGDGYWTATVDGYSPGAGRLEFTYKIPLDLSTSNLKIGKTLVVQGPGLINSGRFVIKDVVVNCDDGYTFVTVYDGVHATALSPTSAAQLVDDTEVKIYFNSDSVSFNQESATDFTSVSPFKRHFEIYTDSQANTFTHERGRMYVGSPPTTPVNEGILVYTASAAVNLDIVKISPKLRGYQFGTVTKISLRINSYNATTGLIDGYLAANPDGTLKPGPIVRGKIGEVIRFYDESNIDYIDVILDINSGQSTFLNVTIDFQLYPSLSLDDQIMMIGTCQLSDISRLVSQIRDERQFGNTSEKEFSTSALDFISAPERLLHGNGVISGFDLIASGNTVGGQVNFSGGTALVNGKFIQANAQTVAVPPLLESDSGLFDINWGVCINDKGEYQLIPLLDKFGVTDATAGGSSDTNRVFSAYNIVNGNIYSLDSSTFENIVSNRKDLTILYVIKSQVSDGPVFGMTISDARKRIYSETSNIPFTWIPSKADRPGVVGHFNSLHAVITWINMYGANNTTVKVKGTFDINLSSLDFSNIRNTTIFEGDGATFNVTITGGLVLKRNVTLKNINFNYNPTLFTNTGNINGGAGCVYGDTELYTSNKFIENIVIENCTFNSETASHPPFICFRVAPDLEENIGGYVKDVTIKDNKFNDTTDHPAAIAFLNTYHDDTNSGLPASVLVNVLVENNICNTNQIIFLASTFTVTADGAGDTPGLMAFNVVVRNNKCGAIAYSTSGSTKFSASITQKENGLTIEDNKCITIISPVDQTGKVPINYIGPSRLTYNRFYGTGIVTIKNNTCSYISVVNRRSISSSYPATMIISGNRLAANDYLVNVKNVFNFDASADTNVLGTGTTLGVAIYVDHTTANTSESLTDVFIENNVITQNTYNSALNIDDGTGTFPFTRRFYEAGIFSYVPAIIKNNTISGYGGVAYVGSDPKAFGIKAIKSATYTGGIYFCSITDNHIFRGAAELNFYIWNTGFNRGEVVDNFFDSSYCDAALNTLVVRHTAASTVDRNKNQIFTKYLRASDFGTIVETNHSSQVPPVSVGNPGGNSITYPPTSLSKSGFSIVYGNSQVVTDSINGSLSITMPTPTASVIHSAALIMPLKQVVPLGVQLFNVSVDYRMTSDATVAKAFDFYVFKYGSGGGPFDAVIFHNTVTDSTLDSGVGTLIPSIADTISYPSFDSVYFDEPYPWLQLYFTVSGGTGGTSIFHISDITIQYVY